MWWGCGDSLTYAQGCVTRRSDELLHKGLLARGIVDRWLKVLKFGSGELRELNPGAEEAF